MRKNRTPGSVQGVSSNRRHYCDATKNNIMNYIKIIILCLSVTILTSCRHTVKQNKTVPIFVTRPPAPEVVKEPYSVQYNYSSTPFSEIDSISDSKPRIILIKKEKERYHGRTEKDTFIIYDYFLFDSLKQDTFYIYSNKFKIDNGITSPTGKYIACLIRISMVDEPGLWGDREPPKRPYEHLVIIDAINGKIIRRLKPPSDSFMDIDKWLSKSRVIFFTSDGFAVGGHFLFDAFRDSLQEIPEDYKYN